MKKILLLLIVMSFSILIGCGKEGIPNPKKPMQSFYWKDIEATPTQNKCILFNASLGGQYNNLYEVRLELAPVAGADECVDCPFVPRQTIAFSKNDIRFSEELGTISFSYCPQEAYVYRWRLVGISNFNDLPHATSPAQVISLE